ncbi:uncharacterized protein LOC121581468 [Coregonus clupeaformis]|uniref:uncharacterized protein LOC121581468 n=1 Tax=Coregonus clupeaformis TaxID=59861 RepID=UPI001BE01C6D|nr:uncharacterized protein LOC121581468 [Coregonus clupeaformis]
MSSQVGDLQRSLHEGFTALYDFLLTQERMLHSQLDSLVNEAQDETRGLACHSAQGIDALDGLRIISEQALKEHDCVAFLQGADGLVQLLHRATDKTPSMERDLQDEPFKDLVEMDFQAILIGLQELLGRHVRCTRPESRDEEPNVGVAAEVGVVSQEVHTRDELQEFQAVLDGLQKILVRNRHCKMPETPALIPASSAPTPSTCSECSVSTSTGLECGATTTGSAPMALATIPQRFKTR